MLNFREAALSELHPPFPRLFRDRDDAFLFSADLSFLPDGWQWPADSDFEAIRIGKVLHLRLTPAALAALDVPEVACPPFDGSARREMLRLVSLHAGQANEQNAFLIYTLWKAHEAGTTESSCRRLLPMAARLINQKCPLPACLSLLL